MPFAVIVRVVDARDAEAVASLAGEFSYPTTAEEMLARLTALAASDDDAVLVAVSEESIVGWIHVGRVTSVQSAAFAEIRGLVVSTSRRSLGIGAALVAAAEEWARTRGFTHIRVRSNLTRERTLAFYERHGYASAKSQKVFDKRLRS